jgi:hypothetical protein
MEENHLGGIGLEVGRIIRMFMKTSREQTRDTEQPSSNSF